MASIKRAKSGKWRARVSFQVNGKQEFQSKQGFDTKKQATIWASKIELLKKSNNIEQLADKKVSDYFEEWVDIYKSGMEYATQYQYQNTLDNIKKYMPNVRMKDFTRTIFQNFINEFGTDHSKETVSKRKNHISQCMRDAFADGVIKKDPTIRIQLTGKPGKSEDDKFLELDDFVALTRYVEHELDSSEYENKSYLAIYIALHTGLRFGEVIALTSDDVDFKNKTISVNKAYDQKHHLKSTKTESSNRTVPVDNALLSRLSGIEGSYCDISNYAVSKTLKKCIGALDIKKVTFHGLRHTFGSVLLTAGVDVKFVSWYLGHKNITTTINIYTHVLNSLKKKEGQKAVSVFSDNFALIHDGIF